MTLMTGGKKMKRSLLLIVGVILITIGAFAVGFEDIYTIVTRMSLGQIGLMTVLQLSTLLLTSYIWFFLLRRKTVVSHCSQFLGLTWLGVSLKVLPPQLKLEEKP